MFKKTLTAAAVAAWGISVSSGASALPALQLYIEGAEYETAAQNATDSNTWARLSNGAFRLWVIGDSPSTGGGPGQVSSETFLSAVLVASYANGLNPMISFSSSTTGGLGGFTDPSTPVAASGPSASPFPIIGSNFAESWSNAPGKSGPLAPHEQLVPGQTAAEWFLGDFSAGDSPIADFNPGMNLTGWLPAPSATETGQINVYDVTVTGLLAGEQIHLDVYGVFSGISCSGTVSYPICGIFIDAAFGAPDTHDARWQMQGGSLPDPDPNPNPVAVPTPSAVLLLLSGLGAFGWARKNKLRA